MSAIALALTISTTFAAQTPPPATANPVPIGVILQIDGRAEIRASADAPATPLDPARDVMRKVYAGQSVRVASAGRLKLGLTTGLREVVAADRWVTLDAPAGLTPEQTRVAQALRRYGVRGGTRGIGSSIFSPADGSAMRASTFVIRWTPQTSGRKVTLLLETEGGRRLWHQADVDENAGVLDAPAARQAIAGFQREGTPQSLVLTIGGAGGAEASVTFTVLSPAAEQDLDNALAGWDAAGDPLLRAVGRAYEFERRRLLVDAADEYDRALTLAPNSREMIASAIEAQRRTGNDARAAELRKRLDAKDDD